MTRTAVVTGGGRGIGKAVAAELVPADVRELWPANSEPNVLSAALVTTALEPRPADDPRVVTIAARRGIAVDVLSPGVTPADVAAAVTFPTSPEAGHVTGRVIGVNGRAGLGR